jgi:hypothetical protein
VAGAAVLEVQDAGSAGAANRALIDARRTTGDDYQQLAAEVRTEDVQRYRRAAAELSRGMNSLELALAQLRTRGFAAA